MGASPAIAGAIVIIGILTRSPVRYLSPYFGQRIAAQRGATATARRNRSASRVFSATSGDERMIHARYAHPSRANADPVPPAYDSRCVRRRDVRTGRSGDRGRGREGVAPSARERDPRRVHASTRITMASPSIDGSGRPHRSHPRFARSHPIIAGQPSHGPRRSRSIPRRASTHGAPPMTRTTSSRCSPRSTPSRPPVCRSDRTSSSYSMEKRKPALQISSGSSRRTGRCSPAISG
jgi:hypothetical protein